MHVRAPSATLCAPNNPYSYSNHGLSPWKKTSIVREDGLRVLCRNFLHSFLSRSISDRFRIEKNSATPFIIFLPIELFRSSKVKYRQDLFETYSDFFEILFRRFFFIHFSLCTTIYNSKWSQSSKKDFCAKEWQVRSVPVNELIRSRLVRSH